MNDEVRLVEYQAVAWFTDSHLTDKSATTYDKAVADRWAAKGWPVTPLYAADGMSVDAGRYRWLRANADIQFPAGRVFVGSDGMFHCGYGKESELDAAIDAFKSP